MLTILFLFCFSLSANLLATESQVKLRDGTYVPKTLFQKTIFYLGRTDMTYFLSPIPAGDDDNKAMRAFLSCEFNQLLTGDPKMMSHVEKILFATIRYSNHGTLLNTDPRGVWDTLPNKELVKVRQLTI